MRVVVGTTTGFHLRRLAVALADLGEDVTYRSYLPSYRLRAEGLHASLAKSMFLPLLPTSALALMRNAPWQTRAVESMLARTDNYLSKHLPASDVFIGLSAMAVRSAEVAREQGARVVIERGSRHVLSQDRLVSQQGGSPLSRRYVERELASYDRADVVTVLSEHAATSFVDEGFPRDRLFVSPLGVDLRTFSATPRPVGPPRILVVGGWSHRKGMDILVSALDRRPEWHVTHVGSVVRDSPPRSHPRITHLGHLSHRMLAAVMAEHHLLALPSREDGFGMVLLEALSSGLPIVASRMTGGPDIQSALDDPSWVEIVEPGDVDDLVRGLDSMLARESAEGELGVRKRLTAHDEAYFSWAGYGSRYNKFLRDLASSEGARRE